MTDKNIDILKYSALEYVKKFATVEEIVLINKVFLEENPNAEYLRDIREVNDKEKEDWVSSYMMWATSGQPNWLLWVDLGGIWCNTSKMLY